MSSKINELIKKYRKQVQELQHWNIEDQGQARILRIQKVSDLFFSMMVYLNADDQVLVRLNQKRASGKVQQLIKRESQRHKIDAKLLQRIMGTYVLTEFQSNDKSFYGINEEMLVHNQDYFNDYKDLGLNDHDSLQDDISTISHLNFLDDCDQKTNETDFFSQLEKTKIKSSGETWGDNPHSMQVTAYLLELGAPQSQLIYLCQYMGWKPITKETQESNKLRVQIELNLLYKKSQCDIKESYLGKNKKISKMAASFKVLRKIYIKYPQIWHLFNDYKLQKSLKIEKNPCNPMKLMTEELMKQQIKEQKMSDIHSQIKEKEKINYLKEITNFKTQMNYLIQQNPNVCFHPKMQKIEDSNGWKVKGQIKVTLKEKSQIYQQVISHKNSKAAQEQIAKLLIQRVYTSHPKLLEKMIAFRQKKFSK